MTEAEQVLIRGKVFLYKQKAPFVPSGMSVYGALEYDEATDKVRCHECAGWFRSVGLHAKMAHGIESSAYKSEHGLAGHSSLSSVGCKARASTATRSRPAAHGFGTRESLKKAIAASASVQAIRRSRGEKPRLNMEFRNERGTCQAQLVNRVQNLFQQLGRSPGSAELKSAGIHPRSACLALGVSSTKQLLDLCGFAPYVPKKTGPRGSTKWSKDLLRDLLVNFFVLHGRLPRGRDFRSRLLPPSATYHNYFGSLPAAYEAAGLGSVAKQRQGIAA